MCMSSFVKQLKNVMYKEKNCHISLQTVTFIFSRLFVCQIQRPLKEHTQQMYRRVKSTSGHCWPRTTFTPNSGNDIIYRKIFDFPLGIIIVLFFHYLCCCFIMKNCFLRRSVGCNEFYYFYPLVLVYRRYFYFTS